MSSKASTTIGFERRFNPALAHDDVALFVAESAGAATPRPPNMQRIVELNRGPFVGAQPEPGSSPCRPRRRRCSTCAPSRAFAAGHLPSALSVPVSGTRFSTKAASCSTDGPVVVAASSEQEAAEAIRGLRSVGDPRRRRLRPRRRTRSSSTSSASSSSTSSSRRARSSIDVREKDERDTGYIAGSRNIPYRLLALGEADLPATARS